MAIDLTAPSELKSPIPGLTPQKVASMQAAYKKLRAQYPKMSNKKIISRIEKQYNVKVEWK